MQLKMKFRNATKTCYRFEYMDADGSQTTLYLKKSAVDTAFAALQERGIAEALLYERKPASVAGLEKALGKKVFAETAADLVVKKPGKPTLVPAADKRPPYNPAAAAFGGGT